MSLREQAFRRAIMNILNNAAKFAQHLHIRLWRRGHVVAIVLDDDGQGIAAEDRDNVFRPFYRGDAARTRGKGEGIGLGLSICKDIILSHGGHIELAQSPQGGLG